MTVSAHRLPFEREAQFLIVNLVDIGGQHIAVAVDLVDEAALALGLDPEAQCQLVFNEREVP
ncbi:hypothetical protein LP419_19840 [Massilia sp. H-1]|nr:hypothetical protein LP419_19840 [Massilia sp. H-1]